MESCWPQNLPSHRKKEILDEILSGQEIAQKLKLEVDKSIDGSMFAVEDLVNGIMTSFTNTLSILDIGGDFEEISRIPQRRLQPACWDGRKSEDSGESSKSCSSTAKDRRGCYKRRKASHSWTNETSTLTYDGYAWRKYGQKQILNAKFPRNYFRCTHKYDEGCQASKQVQKIQEEPPLYRTTYYGHHTCKNLLKYLSNSESHHLLLHPIVDHDHTDSSILLSFTNNKNINHLTNKQNHDPFFKSLIRPIKHEEYYNKDEQEIEINLPLSIHNNISQAASSKYLYSPKDGHMCALDQADVISGMNSSCTTSTHSLDMDGIMVESVGFDDRDDVLGFNFDHN